MSQITATSSQRLSAALLNMDKTAYKHVESKDGNSEYLRISLIKGTKAQGLAGYVQCVPGGKAKNQRSFMEHAGVLRDEFVVFRVSFVTYGKGDIQHPVFNRAMHTETSTEFYVGVNKLNGEYLVLAHGENWNTEKTYVLSGILTSSYGADAKKRLDIIKVKLTALQNSLKNGNAGVVYDERQTVYDKAITPYGQYIIDNGKRQDTDLKDARAAQGYMSAAPTQPDNAENTVESTATA